MTDIRFAVIEDGTVTNAILAPEDFELEGVMLIASDTADIGQLWDGENFTDPPQTPEVLPDLTMRQFRLALLSAGLLNEVETAIDGLSEPERSVARIEFEYASSVSRTSAWIATLAGPINLTNEQIDDLWRSARAL